MIQFGNVRGMSCPWKRKSSYQWSWLRLKNPFTYKVTWTLDAQGNLSKRQVFRIQSICLSQQFNCYKCHYLQLLNAAVSYFMVLREFDHWISYEKCCSAAETGFSDTNFHTKVHLFRLMFDAVTQFCNWKC